MINSPTRLVYLRSYTVDCQFRSIVSLTNFLLFHCAAAWVTPLATQVPTQRVAYFPHGFVYVSVLFQSKSLAVVKRVPESRLHDSAHNMSDYLPLVLQDIPTMRYL